MFLSIIIPIFNDASYLKEALFNIDFKNIEGKVELILIDSSNDDSASSVVSEFRSKNPLIEVIYRRIEPSFAGRSMNEGIKLSSGQFLCFLDTKTIPVEGWPNDHLRILKYSNVEVVFGTTQYEADTNFQKLLKATSYGNILHESVPGSVMKKAVFKSTGLFSPNLRSSYDIEWKNKVKKFSSFKTPNFRTILYSKLPKSFFDAAKKYFIYSLHTAKADVQLSVKQAYLSILLILSALLIPRWNYLLTGWDSNPLYIPDITKIYLFSIVIILVLTLIINSFFLKTKESNLFYNSLKFIVFLFLSLSIYRWNAVLASWVESAVLYVPHITKLYLSSLVVLSVLYRGLVMPLSRKESKLYLFPFKWIQVGILGLVLDIIKMPGYTIGAFIALFRGITRAKTK
tara:strand:+ start:27906 stop:29105 length:1200 start_codon:yes stop_codon:yes gene_type:complete